MGWCKSCACEGVGIGQYGHAEQGQQCDAAAQVVQPGRRAEAGRCASGAGMRGDTGQPTCRLASHLSRPRDRLGGSWKSTERHSSMRVLHSSAKRRHTPAHRGGASQLPCKAHCSQRRLQMCKIHSNCADGAAGSNHTFSAHPRTCATGCSPAGRAHAQQGRHSGLQTRWAAAAGATPSPRKTATPAAWCAAGAQPVVPAVDGRQRPARLGVGGGEHGRQRRRAQAAAAAAVGETVGSHSVKHQTGTSVVQIRQTTTQPPEPHGAASGTC